MVWAVMAVSVLSVCVCVVVLLEVKGAGRHDWDNKRHGI